jgi:sensor histidine kinase YesM
MITTLNEQSARMMAAAAEGLGSIYLQDRGDELVRLSDYIIEDLQLIAEIYMDEISRFYRVFSRRITRMTYLSLGMLFLAMVFAIYIVRRFVMSVTMPVHKLALQLVRFGEGDLKTRVGEIGGRDEIAVLGRSFDSMADRIRVLIDGIKDKAEIEQRLVEQRLAREEVERLLKEAELAHLQAQINPHFLFNTLNILGSLSVIEEAPRTGSVIADLSELLRYSLRTGSGLVQLKEEIDVVRSYMNIQQFRFDGKISYTEIIPEKIPELRMPGMILQPLAENAVKHGLEPIERRGIVTLSISTENSAVVIELSDDGVGISDRALELLSDSAVQTDSLGIRNVQRRLALHYEKDIIQIRRLTSGGTSCRITLPVPAVISG